MAATEKKSAVGKSPTVPLVKGAGQKKDFRALFYYWLKNNYIYVLAFAIPALLTYIAYILFGIYPFGPESVLVLDLNGQYVYYFEELRDTFWGDGSIFYTWSKNLSGEFMGTIGYYLASPFTLIVLILPRQMLLGSLLIMQLCKLGTAGVTFCYFLRKSKGIKPLQALMFSMLYAMMAYAVIQLIDPMWLDGIVFLPLICLGLEYCIDDGRKINYIIPLALMCIANFYIGFMVCIFTGLYFVYYLLAGSDKLKRRHLKSKDFKQYGLAIGRVAFCTVVALMIAAVMLLPVYNALKLGKFDFTKPNYAFKDVEGHLRTQFEIFDVFAQLFVNQYSEVNVKGMPEIYCGVLSALLLPLFFLNGGVPFRKKVGLTSLALVLVVSMDLTPIDMLWHGGQVPNWLPFRYSFLLSFVLLNMAALTVHHLKDLKPSAIYGSFALLFMFLMFVQYEKNKNNSFEYLDTKSFVWLSVGLLAVYAVLLFLMQKKNKSKIFPLLMILVVSCELVCNTYHSMKDIDKEVAYSERKTYNKYIASGRELVEQMNDYDDGFYRSDKTYHRTVNDSLAFGQKGISHSTSVMNTRIIKFIEAMGYTCRSYYTKYNGSTPISDSLLGIKYIADMDGKVNQNYERVFDKLCYTQQETEKLVTVYKNPTALGIGYMVDDDIKRISALGNDNPFNSQNVLLSSLLGKTVIDNQGSITQTQPYFHAIPLVGEPTMNGVSARPYGVQTCYDVVDKAADPTVDIRIKAETNEPIYFYFKTENEKKVNLWLSPHWNAEGQFEDSTFISKYFEGDDYCIMNLGSFEPGQELTIRCTLTDTYTIVQNFFFYHFNYDLFKQDIAALQDQQWELTRTDANHLEGKIQAETGQLMMTSIPYEPGWTIKVDGKKVEPTIVVNALIGVELEPGEHTVSMHFVAKGFTTGVLLLVCGLFCVVLCWWYDRKNNKLLISVMKERREKRDAYLEVSATKRKA